MKNTLLLKSTGLLVIAFTVMGLLFTSANTKESVNSQAVVALSAELAKMKSEIGALKMEKETAGPAESSYIGEISMFAGNFPPRDWAFCNGQLLDINSHSALFAILGTTYGGDGRRTFGLPDLRGRTPIHTGNSQGPGLSQIRLGQKGGVESITTRTVNVSDSGNVNVVKELPEGSNRAPFLGVNYIICLQGNFPPRD